MHNCLIITKKESHIWQFRNEKVKSANSHKILTKFEVRSSYYWPQFGFIYPHLATKYHFCHFFISAGSCDPLSAKTS